MGGGLGRRKEKSAEIQDLLNQGLVQDDESHCFLHIERSIS